MVADGVARVAVLRVGGVGAEWNVLVPRVLFDFLALREQEGPDDPVPHGRDA